MTVSSLLATLQPLRKVATRFPLTILCCFLAFIIRLNEATLEPALTAKSLATILISLLYAALWSVAIKLISESKKLSQKYYYVISILPMFGIIIISLKLPMGCFYIFPAFIALILLAPFLNCRPDNKEIWSFNHHLFAQTLYTILASIIFYIGFAAIFTIFSYLLDIKLWAWYKQINIIIFTLFIPIMILIGTPTNFKELPQEKQAQALRNILQYIIIPVTFVYLAVFYIYLAKIIISQNLPKNEIIKLFIPLCFVGISSYFFADKGERFDSRLIRFYKKYFFKILAAPLILASVAIELRINKYGFTHFRYLVCLGLLGQWLILLFSCIKNNKYQTKFIYIITIILLVLAIFNPWHIKRKIFNPWANDILSFVH